jgi:hypothetical protein
MLCEYVGTFATEMFWCDSAAAMACRATSTRKVRSPASRCRNVATP